MGFRRHAVCQCQFHGGELGLFIVVQHKRQNIDHLTIATRFAQHVVLQLFEARRQFQTGCTVPKGDGLTLNDRHIAPPVINRPWRPVVTAFDDPRVFTKEVTLGRHD